MATLDIANPDGFLTQFNKALNAAPSPRLRGIIRDICKLHPAAISTVSDTLLVTEDQVPEQDDSDSDSESESGSEGSSSKVKLDISAPAPPDDDNGILEVKPATLKSKKRVRPRYAVCVNCREEYDVSKKSRESCYFHPEEAVEVEEYWDNFDLWSCDGPIDTEENREDHPEGFIYARCENNYGEEGCKVSWHQHEEETGDLKRRRA